jgi:hypothetical protein
MAAPVFGAAVGACEQSAFAGKLDRTDRTFDGVVVEFDRAIFNTAIFNVSRQALPSRQSITDGAGELAFRLIKVSFARVAIAQMYRRVAGPLPDETALSWKQYI